VINFENVHVSVHVSKLQIRQVRHTHCSSDISWVNANNSISKKIVYCIYLVDKSR